MFSMAKKQALEEVACGDKTIQALQVQDDSESKQNQNLKIQAEIDESELSDVSDFSSESEMPDHTPEQLSISETPKKHDPISIKEDNFSSLSSQGKEVYTFQKEKPEIEASQVTTNQLLDHTP